MVEKVACPSCGASLGIENGKTQTKCAYCGSNVVYSTSEKIRGTAIPQSELSAVSFLKSLEVEIKGQRASITDMWDSIMNNPNLGEDKLLSFYKNLKERILFCIEVYKNLPAEAKYELGDFVCEQMDSIINFRIVHGLRYDDELEDLETYERKVKYDYGAVGWFNFKKKLLLLAMLKRIEARKTIIYYDAAMYSVNIIEKEYGSKLQVLKEELNATDRTAFSRRKEIKNRIDTLEMQKKDLLNRLGVKEKTKEYHKVVKKYKIQHVDLIAEEENAQATNGATSTATTPTASTEKKEAVAEINYNEMSILELLDALEESLNVLSKGVLKSEIEKCKKINDAIGRCSVDNQNANIYLNAVTMSVNMLFQNETPAVVKAMVTNSAANTKMQINNLRKAVK